MAREEAEAIATKHIVGDSGRRSRQQRRRERRQVPGDVGWRGEAEQVSDERV